MLRESKDILQARDRAAGGGSDAEPSLPTNPTLHLVHRKLAADRRLGGDGVGRVLGVRHSNTLLRPLGEHERNVRVSVEGGLFIGPMHDPLSRLPARGPPEQATGILAVGGAKQFAC
jgi:hypothetical protein